MKKDMIYLTITLVLLTILCIYMGWRIGKLEDQQKEIIEAEKEVDEFLADICDTLNCIWSKEHPEVENLYEKVE